VSIDERSGSSIGSPRSSPAPPSLRRGGVGGATRPFPRDGGAGDPIAGPRSKVWTRGQRWKKYCSAKDGAPERLGCGTIQQEVSQILQARVSAGAARRILLPFYLA